VELDLLQPKKFKASLPEAALVAASELKVIVYVTSQIL